MIKISGHVKLQGQEVGIPNLVVAAYDTEKSLDEIITDHNDGEGFNASLMQCLGRISSVLTDSKGKFLIDTRDLKIEGNISRPNLIIIVFAPEDTIEKKTPVPLPPEKRILYLSVKPRIRAGAEEAYSIRLLQKQIDEFNIPIHPESDDAGKTQASVTRYLRNVEDNYILKERTKELTGQWKKEKQEKDAEARVNIREKIKNLSSLPLAVRKNIYLLKDRNDLEKFQKKAVTEGLKKFKNYENTVRLNLTAKDLQFLKLKPGEKGTFKAKVDTALLTTKLKELTGGVDLIRKKDLLPSQIDPLTLYSKYFPEKREETTNKENPE